MNTWKGKVLSQVNFGHVLVNIAKEKFFYFFSLISLSRICLDLVETLTPEKNETAIVLLKIEANFRENQIVRSMYQPGEGWLQEEISKNWKNGTPKNPLIPGQSFNFRVAVLQKCFEIYVNDKLYGTFEHLQCPNKINHVVATGDFEKITQFHHRTLFPLVFPKTLSNYFERECFQSDVPKKYEIGTIVCLEGIARGSSSTEFSICFLCNETGRVFLKFSVNFDKKIVSRTFQRENHRFHSDDEETIGEFPFKRGKLFKIAFGLGEKAFLISINGKFFTYFNFPFINFEISTLKCYCNEYGDFYLTEIEYYLESSILTRLDKFSSLKEN